MKTKHLNEIEMEKYLERTRRNHYWVGGEVGQRKIHDFKVGIAGLGGMGSNIAEIFCRLGVGGIRGTDPDKIERTNLNRQVIAFEDTVGSKKAEACVQELRRISKDTEFEFSIEGIQDNNADAFVKGLDVVINEIDVFHIDKQILLIEAAHRQNIPVYTTLVVGLGIHLYKYDPNSNYKAKDFLEIIIKNRDVKTLIDRLGQPLPKYLQGEALVGFVAELNAGNVPIFGASTFLGQSLLAIRVLYDFGMLGVKNDLPKTPSLPEFLVLDPLTLEFNVALVT